MNILDPYGYMIPEIFNDGEVIPPPVIRDGSTVAWFLSDELATLTRDGANRVSRWNDYLGSGHDLIQANGADQPLWSANGVLFDGVSEFMKTAPFAYVQPEMIYMVVKQVAWNLNGIFLDGNAAPVSALYQNGITPEIRINAGVIGPIDGSLAVDTWGIVRVLFNGAASTLQVNTNAQWIGNAGANDMGGFTLGLDGAAAFNNSNIQVKEIILRNVADAAPAQTAIYAYLAAKYGI